jgi:MFS family permease
VTRGMFGPTKDAYLNEEIPSKERATLISFEGIAHHVGGVIGLTLSGLLAQQGGIPLSWAVSGIVMVGATLFVARKKR